MEYNLTEILANVEQIREAIYGEEVRGSISNSIEMMAYETDTIQGFKDGVDKILTDYKKEYEQNFRDFADSVHRDMDKHVADMNDKYSQFSAEVNRELNNHKVAMDNAFAEFKNSIHLTISNFTNEINEKVDNIQDEWIKYQQKTDLAIADFKLEMSNKYQEFTEKIIAENSALKESVKRDIAGMKNDIMQFEEATNQTLAKYQQELGETITSWDKTLTDKLAQNTKELEAIQKDIEDKLSEASQANPNLELTDAREGEATLKDNLTKNYAKKEYVAEEILTVNNKLKPIETDITELKTTTQDIGGRTTKLEEYVITHKNPVLSVNQKTPDSSGSVIITTSDVKTPEGEPIENILQNASANDLASRLEIIDLKLALKEKLAIDFINKTGIGFYDTFETTEYIDKDNTTATHNSSNKNVEFKGELKQAVGSITLKTNPSVGETITVGDITYTFKETPIEETNIQIGTNLQTTADNLISKLNTNSLVEVV